MDHAIDMITLQNALDVLRPLKVGREAGAVNGEVSVSDGIQETIQILGSVVDQIPEVAHTRARLVSDDSHAVLFDCEVDFGVSQR